MDDIKCMHCGSAELTYNQLVEDSYCACCGQWELGEY